MGFFEVYYLILFTLVAQSDLVAELDSGTAGSLIGVAGTLSGVGFSVWFGWYTTTKTFPDITRVHKETIADLNRTHRAAIEQITIEFRTELREQRSFYSTEFKAFVEAQKEESDARREAETRMLQALENIAEKVKV